MLLIMRFTAILLLAACLQVSAAGFSQRVTISQRNVTLQRVIAEIKKQTGYNFVYKSEVLKKAHNVSIHVQNASLSEVLNLCFKDQPLSYTIIEKIVVVKPLQVEKKMDDPLAFAFFIEVTGRVLNEKGEPVEGATVTVKGTNRSTSTAAKGIFVLRSLRPDATLVISGVDIETTEVKVEGRSDLEIRVKTRVVSMNEVAVVASTGYQTISRERATGAYDVVGQEVLSKRPVSNLSTALQGVVAGMQAKENVDGSVDFLIRGNSSLYASAKPLIVVDGFPVIDSTFASINPNDVLSVTVLKDAAAASIWGARSANGVIVVTTKQGRAGKLNVEFNAFSRISKKMDLDQVLVQATAKDQIAYEKLGFTNEWFFNPYAGSFSEIGKSLTLAQELLFANKNGTLATDVMNRKLDSLSNINNREQIKDLLMQRAVLNQYNLSLSGGSDRSRTHASLLYETNKTAFIKSGYNRYMLNFNNQFRPSNSITLMVGATLQYRKQETSGATVGEIQSLSPYETLLNPDGSYSVNLKTYNREQMALLPLAKFPYQDWTFNLLREVNGRKLTNEDLNARLQAGLNIKIFKGLTLDARLQYERQRREYENYYSEETFEARNLVNSLVEYNNNTKEVTKTYLPKGGILRSSTGSIPDITNTESFLVRNQLNFNRTFLSQHEVNVIAGAEISEYRTNTRTNPWVFGYYPEKLQASVPQYGYGSSVDQFKNFTGSNATISGANTVFGWRLDRYVSFYGNASYTYNGKYTVSGSVRSDASNFITDNPSLRWAPLWSFGGMWNIKREDFMETVDFFNSLNIRATFGKNGNAEKSTSTQALLNIGGSLNATTGTITGTVSDNGNPQLRWEETTIRNLGIDFSILRSKVYGKIDLYNKLGEGIVGVVALPAATGTTSQKFNNAKISNKGVEVELGVNLNIPNTGIRYNTSVTYSYNKNTITDLYYPALYAYAMLDSQFPAFVEGRPVGSIYSYTYLGMIDGVPHVAGPKGAPSTFGDAALHNRGLGLQFLNYEGTSVPPHTLGWLNNIGFKNFNLLVLFVGKLGGVYRNPTFGFASTTLGSSKTFVDRFVKDVIAGDPNIPGFAKPKETQLYLWDRYTPYLRGLVESSSYIECKEITLDYSFPASLSNRIRMEKLKLFAQMRDLGLVYHANSKGYNPDWLPGQNRPLPTYTFGLSVQF